MASTSIYKILAITLFAMVAFTSCKPITYSCATCLARMESCIPMGKIDRTPMRDYFEECFQPFHICLKLACQEKTKEAIQKSVTKLTKVQRAYNQFKKRILKIQMQSL